MHAIEVSEIGGPEVLTYREVPVPSPRPGEVLIKADAIGVNFVDTYFRSGMYPHELPFVLGSEVCGTVEAVGDDVSTVRVGDRVASADAVGAYAEYCIAPASLAARVPDVIASDVVAASLLKGLTAHLLIKSVYPVKQGDTILVHAGAGGVGLILTHGRPPWEPALSPPRPPRRRPSCLVGRVRWRCSTIRPTRLSSGRRSVH